MDGRASAAGPFDHDDYSVAGTATLDVRQLSREQVARSHQLFAKFLDHDFLPANEAYHDPARQALDQAVLIDLLGLPESVLEPLAVLPPPMVRRTHRPRRQIHPAAKLARIIGSLHWP